MDKASEETRIKDFQREIHQKIEERAQETGLVDSETKPIYDGVADIPGYVATKPKIMWVLKEAWGIVDEKTGKIKGDYTDIWECWTEKGFNTPTWLPMLYILYGLRVGQGKIKYNDMPKANMEMVNLLKQTAYINVSKIPGEKKSGNMSKKYEFWMDIIRAQIEGYNPDVIIFGGTFDTMKRSFIAPRTKPISKTPTQEIAHFYKDEKGRLLVNAMHPAQRHISWDFYVDEIVDRIRELHLKK
ncbi:MAG: hypothetical protein K2G77_05985 [Muribaculaceae bacterium]|nr:hypothetical protein [Muribaculaceae bacterium]